MSKLPNLLRTENLKANSLLKKFSKYGMIFLLVAGCSHATKNGDDSLTPPIRSDSGDDVQVNKKQNSIRVTPDVTDEKINKRLRRKPQFDWPVWEARMTRGYLPRGKGRRKRPHKGIDLAAPRGSAVMAAHDGTIIYTGSGFRGYGKMIMIESNDGWATLYGHLDKIVVYEGKKIRQGEVIGALGNTGRSSGPHLHFEIRQLNGPVDPLPLLPAGEALTNDVDNGAAEE